MAATLMVLADYEAAARALVGAAFDATIWTNTLLDQGLRMALDEYREASPIEEAVLTVTTAGLRQDLSAISNLWRVVNLAWPWPGGAGLRVADYLVPWRLVADKVVLLDGAYSDPHAGDAILVQHRVKYVVGGLDGASSTTVPENDQVLLTLGMAGWAAEIHYRQMADSPKGVLPARARGLASWSYVRLREFRQQLGQVARGMTLPSWGGIGQ